MPSWLVATAISGFDALCLALVLASSLLLAGNFLFPAMLRLVSWSKKDRMRSAGRPVRSISVIVPAYNEEKSIGEKIDTLRQALRRVKVPAEVIIGSDGSTDGTAAIVRERLQEPGLTNWRLLEFPNEGKCSTLNKMVQAARGEVIVSTDADIPVPENALAAVVDAFEADSRLGCLSCIPCFKGLEIGTQRNYWTLEERVRSAESALGSLIVVTGMLYAYRKEWYHPIPPGVMADDLWIPLNVLLAGQHSMQLPELLVPYEKTDERTEISRRKRVMVGGMDVVRRLFPRLCQSPGLLCLVLLHKVNRWLFPFWLGLLLLALLGLWPPAGLCYLLGLVVLNAYLGGGRFRTLAYAALTPLLSLVEVLRNGDFARWEHTRNE